jgi:hypothetical protein
MRRWWVKVLLGIVVVIAICGVSFFGSTIRSKSELERFKDQLKAAGEKLDIKEVVPPKVSTDENAEALFLTAQSILRVTLDDSLATNPPSGMRTILPGRAIVAWKQSQIRYTTGTNSWEDLRAALTSRAFATDSLRAGSRKARLQFELDYSKGFDLLLPHLTTMKKSAQLASAATLCDLHDQKTDSAVTNLHSALMLLKIWDREPILISQLVRLAMLQIDYVTQWELLQATNISDGQLKMLQADWKAIELLNPMEDALVGERALSILTIDHWRGSNAPPVYYFGGGPSSGSGDFWENLKDQGRELRSCINYSIWRSSWSMKDQLFLLRTHQVLLDSLREIQKIGYYKDGIAESHRKAEAALKTYSTENRFRIAMADEMTALVGSPLSEHHSLERLLAAEAAKQMSITAIALKRFELKYEHLPEQIDLLAPEFLEIVSPDPVDGQSLRYKLNTNGSFLLYSIAANALDDGGSAISTNSNPKSFNWQSGLDWVWPQPATEAEIRAWEASQSRP